ncbi:MAG: hypothetical protein IH859_04640 [Chloroflexi bacterium]|nr:hypothetical protein [Chloroflexota bacterium]
MKEKTNPNVRLILRNLAIEMVLYAILLIGYFLVVLQYIAEPLTNYFNNDLTAYAFIGLGLIIAQAVLLDNIVVFLIKLLGLDHSE